MNRVLGFLGVLLLAFLPVGGGLGADDKQQLVERIIAAYGGDALLALPRLAFEDRTRRLQFGQSVRPDEIDLTPFRASIVIDFENNRKSWRSAAWLGNERYTQNQFFDGSRGVRLNHTARTFAEDASLSFARADRSLSYTLDTVLVRLLHDAAGDARYAGEVSLDGVLHHTLVFQAEGHPEMTLFINEESAVISKMTRPHWMEGQVHSYRFSRHERQDGILYAADTYVLSRGQPRTITVSREVTFNPSMDGLFDIPAVYEEEGAGIDFSEMTAQAIGEGVYIVGQNWGFSLFVDEGDHFTAAGGYAGFTDRYKAVTSLVGESKPVKYFIVSHHHLDHMGGMQEISELGATFVVHQNHLASLQARLNQPVAESDVVLINGEPAAVGARVQVIDVPSGHASHNLSTYVHDDGSFFSADMFFSRQQQGGVRATAALAETLQRLRIAPRQFVAAHSSRPLLMNDLTTAIGEDRPDRCPESWAICSP